MYTTQLFTELTAESFLQRIYSKSVIICGSVNRAKEILQKENFSSLAFSGAIRFILKMSKRMEEIIAKEEREALKKMIHDMRNVVLGIKTNALIILKNLEEGDHTQLLRDLADLGFAAEVSQKRIVEFTQDFVGKCFEKLKKTITSRDKASSKLNRVIQTALNISECRQPRNTKVHVNCLTPASLRNEDALVTVLLNLFINSYEAMDDQEYRNDTNPSLKVWAEVKGDGITISVEDNGIGIPPEYLESICSLDVSTKARKGRGIGLHNCMEEVEQKLNGQMTIESELGQGTKVTLEIPL